MPVFTLVLAKIIFLVFFYIFIFWCFRTVGRTLRDTAQAKGGAEPKLRKVPQLEVVEPKEHKGAKIPLSDQMTIGRDESCVLQLDDNYVSALHSKIIARGDDFFISDAGSTNGTMVNRKKISEATRIRRGDTVQIGRTVMEVKR